jgi:hypothetical protein
MAESAQEIFKALQTIEDQLAMLRKALTEAGIAEGQVGQFDGEAMILADGTRIPVPANYASKSMLVPGDTLRMVPDPNGGDQPRFKQIGKVERAKATGLVTRKDGKYEIICEEGSFKVLSAAVKHFEIQPGDSVTIQFAKHHTKGSWAAIEKVATKNDAPTAAPAEATTTPQPSAIVHQVAEEKLPVPSPATDVPAATPAPQKPQPTAKQHVTENKRQEKKPLGKRPSDDRRTSVANKTAATPAKSKNETPHQDLSADQGEISIPLVMDDDDLT